MSKKSARSGGPKASASNPPSRRRTSRINWPFGVAVLVLLALIGAGVWGLTFWRNAQLIDSAIASSDDMLKQGRREAAIQILYKYLDQNPTQPKVLRRLADIRSDSPRSAQEIREAAILYERLLRRLPGRSPEGQEIRRKIAKLDLDFTELLYIDPSMKLRPIEDTVQLSRVAAVKTMLDSLKSLDPEPTAETERLWARYHELTLSSQNRDPENADVAAASRSAT